MHKISLAPVLSATRSRDSCWITFLLLSSHWFSRDASLVERSMLVAVLPPRFVVVCRERHTTTYYLAFSRISTTRQRFCADSGRVSMISTRSPTPQDSCSSCALTRAVL